MVKPTKSPFSELSDAIMNERLEKPPKVPEQTKFWTYEIINWTILDDDSREAENIAPVRCWRTEERAREELLKDLDDQTFGALAERYKDNHHIPAAETLIAWDNGLNRAGQINFDWLDHVSFTIYEIELRE